MLSLAEGENHASQIRSPFVEGPIASSVRLPRAGWLAGRRRQLASPYGATSAEATIIEAASGHGGGVPRPCCVRSPCSDCDVDQKWAAANGGQLDVLERTGGLASAHGR